MKSRLERQEELADLIGRRNSWHRWATQRPGFLDPTHMLFSGNALIVQSTTSGVKFQTELILFRGGPASFHIATGLAVQGVIDGHR